MTNSKQRPCMPKMHWKAFGVDLRVGKRGYKLRAALSTFYMAEYERTGNLDDMSKEITQVSKSLITQESHRGYGLTGKMVLTFKNIVGYLCISRTSKL